MVRTPVVIKLKREERECIMLDEENEVGERVVGDWRGCNRWPLRCNIDFLIDFVITTFYLIERDQT